MFVINDLICMMCVVVIRRERVNHQFHYNCLPLQDKPFELRLYPVLQEQVYDPSVF